MEKTLDNILGLTNYKLVRIRRGAARKSDAARKWELAQRIKCPVYMECRYIPEPPNVPCNEWKYLRKRDRRPLCGFIFEIKEEEKP